MAAAAADSLPPLPIPLTPPERGYLKNYYNLFLAASVRSQIYGTQPLDLSRIQQINDLPEGPAIQRILQLAAQLLLATPADALPPVESLFEANVPHNWMENPATPVAWAVHLQTLQWQGVLLAALNKGDPEFLRTLLPSLNHLLPEDPYSSEVFDVLLMADLEPDMRHQLMKVLVENMSPPDKDWNIETAEPWKPLLDLYTEQFKAERIPFRCLARFLGILMRVGQEQNSRQEEPSPEENFFSANPHISCINLTNLLEIIYEFITRDFLVFDGLHEEQKVLTLCKEFILPNPENPSELSLLETNDILNTFAMSDNPNVMRLFVALSQAVEFLNKRPAVTAPAAAANEEEPPAKRLCLSPNDAVAAAADS